MKKHIDPTISILIVVIAFVIAVFLIFQGEVGFKNQASLMKVIDGESECLETAYIDFLTNWNQECKAERLEDKCSLDKEKAYPLKADYQKAKNNCY